jgi:tetratricopeptide (TPR) repeat protein
MRLSLCMIVKDEQELLPACLASVQGVVDEMVILDTGSSDRSLEIATAYGARVYQSEWPNDFSVARNQALQYVQGEWVLVLDADEVLLPDIITPLHQAIQDQNLLVINLLRQEQGQAQTPYSLVSRLFRRHPQLYFSRPYHELVDDSVAEILQHQPHWRVGYLPQVAILHSGYQAAAIAQRGKTERARTLMSAYLAQHPQDAYIASKLGALYVQQGESQSGIQLLEQGLVSPALEPNVRFELHYHLGIAYGKQAQFEIAAAHYQAATLQSVPEFMKLAAYNNWGSLLQEQGDWLAAQQQFQQVLKIDPTFAIGHYNLGITLKAQGDYGGAISAYQRALELQPDYAQAHQNLGVVLLKVGQVPASLAAFRQAIALLESTHPAAATHLRAALEEMGLPI